MKIQKKNRGGGGVGLGGQGGCERRNESFVKIQEKNIFYLFIYFFFFFFFFFGGGGGGGGVRMDVNGEVKLL